jgi:hypothetical protein
MGLEAEGEGFARHRTVRASEPLSSQQAQAGKDESDADRDAVDHQRRLDRERAERQAGDVAHRDQPGLEESGRVVEREIVVAQQHPPLDRLQHHHQHNGQVDPAEVDRLLALGREENRKRELSDDDRQDRELVPSSFGPSSGLRARR